MLKRILLKNFQKHRKQTIEFGKGVTTIVGRTDSGKSAILRALRYILTNKPSGNAFIRHGSKTADVWIKIDGITIRRLKGKKNEYKTSQYKTNKPAVYKAFGSDIPDELEKLFNVDSVNFQDQHDAPFWLSLTPGQVAKEINHITKLDAIDNAVEYIAREQRQATASSQALRLMQEDAVEAMQPLSDYPRCRASFGALSSMEHDITTLGALIVDLRTCTSKGSYHALNLSKGVKTAQEGVLGVKLGASCVKLQRETLKLSSLVENAIKLNEATMRDPPLDELHTLSILKETLATDYTLIDKLTWLKNEGEQFLSTSTTLTDQIVKAEKILTKKMKGKCPLCGNKIKL